MISKSEDFQNLMEFNVLAVRRRKQDLYVQTQAKAKDLMSKIPLFYNVLLIYVITMEAPLFMR